MGRYDYDILRERALSADATPEDLMNFGDWFQQFGMYFWNGEVFDADGVDLVPLYSDPDEYGDVQIVGYEIR